ncbi:MAG: hydroxymethylglutaryl-CoA reductase [Bernardetiaceae bacterium]|nr:hydroxymethylglutaryl-CoA reductase [Bernardetiaceae bacterium]
MQAISGYSKLSKEEKLEWLARQVSHEPEAFIAEMKSYWHNDHSVQKLFDEFSENTLTNFYMPFGIVPNVLLNGELYAVPMVIEESSVVAAAAQSAKFWLTRGGFKAQVLGTKKIGQVHFLWEGDFLKLDVLFEDLKEKMLDNTALITKNMRQRGGGILDIELVNMTHIEPHYYQFKATFETCDSMGANFINTCLEEFARTFKQWAAVQEGFTEKERNPLIIMSILSNYTPECLVKAWVECPVAELGSFEGMDAEMFAFKFQKAITIAKNDVYRATTHNKGIFNGIDAVALATGNDFRAVEACGHVYAARDGKYRSLTDCTVENGIFRFWITVPLALGTVGGLTSLHPIVRRSFEILGYPNAQKLMQITAAIGLAQNFAAVKSLVTTGIQKGHMKMHLLNILRHFGATEEETKAAIEHFKHHVVSFSAVRDLLDKWREAAEIKRNHDTDSTATV